MTDADVDGAHIAALLMTFFYKELPELVRQGRVFLAQPPLFRLQAGGKSIYARDDADGTAEQPYPPDYPKMPGEPPRVQPSKKNPANWQ